MNNLEKKKYFKKNGIIKLKLFKSDQLINYRKKILDLFKSEFDLNKNISELKLGELEAVNKNLWSGLYKNITLMEEIFLIINKCFKVANNSIFGLKRPVLCNTPNVKINFPFNASHNIDVHQDIHSHLGSLNSITMWIPLQDTKNIMGPIEYIPGSHRLIRNAKNGILTDKFKNNIFKSMNVSLGECLIFSQLLVHKSVENKSKKARVSMQIRFNDLASSEWKDRNYYSVEKKIREKPNSKMKKTFKLN